MSSKPVKPKAAAQPPKAKPHAHRQTQPETSGARKAFAAGKVASAKAAPEKPAKAAAARAESASAKAPAEGTSAAMSRTSDDRDDRDDDDDDDDDTHSEDASPLGNAPRKRSRKETDATDSAAGAMLGSGDDALFMIEGMDGEAEIDVGEHDAKTGTKMQKLLNGVAKPSHPIAKWHTQKYRNKQRTLVFASRGINSRPRHLVNDLRLLMPHSKKEGKFDGKDKLFMINEICELKSCSTAVFFESRKHDDVFLWISRIPHGPSAKFHCLNVHTMEEMKLMGNALRGSRPVLSFDGSFDTVPYLRLLKEMFTQVFGTPNRHPKSKPFVDHVLAFTFLDNRIWFRTYQMYDQQLDAARDELRLIEIGPRFVLNLVRIFEGSFCGATLYENPRYLSPNQVRINLKRNIAATYRAKKVAESKLDQRAALREAEPGELDDVFA